MNNLSKTIIGIIIIIFLFDVGYVVWNKVFRNTPQEPVKSQKAYTVGIVRLLDIEAFQDIEKGIMEELDKIRAEKGVVINVETRLPGGDAEKSKEYLQELINKPVDILLTIGTQPSLQALELTKENKIPIVYFAAPAPKENRIVDSIEASGKNITGSAVKIPMNAQIEMLKKVLPNAKRIGILYSARVPALVLADEADQSAQLLGFDIERLFVDEENPAAVRPLIESFAKKIDAIYIPANTFLYAPPQFTLVIEESNRQKLPVVVITPAEVSKGALFSLHANFKESGQQGAELISKILFDGRDIGTIPSRFPSNYQLTISRKAAQTLGITIPETVLGLAYRVVD